MEKEVRVGSKNRGPRLELWVVRRERGGPVFGHLERGERFRQKAGYAF